MEARKKEIRYYISPNGKHPFDDWFRSLRDATVRAQLLARIDRLRLGNFGDCRSVGGGVHELRVHYGPGYRIYFGMVGSGVVIILGGGSKSTQAKDIKYAQKIWKSYTQSAN